MSGYHVSQHAATGPYSSILSFRTDLPLPDIGDKQVLVQVAASSVNPVDFYVLRGFMDKNPHFPRKAPYVAGYDVSGVVVKVGTAVKGYAVGDEVFGSADFYAGSVKHGSWAQYAPIAESNLGKKPANVSFEEAAAISIAGSSAYESIVTHGALQAGERVLILAGAGGVGTYGIQIARAIGGPSAFIATTCSPNNNDFVKKLGANETIDYNTQDWGQLYGSKDESEKFDIVIDFAGGKAEWERAQKAVKKTGRYMTICGDRDAGASPVSKNEERANATPKYRGIFAKCNDVSHAAIAQLMAEGKVRSIIDSTFAFAEADAACAKAETRKVKGKIVLKVDSPKTSA